MTEATQTPSPEVPSLDQLAEQKEQAFKTLTNASSALKAACREAANAESKIAAYLIGMGRPHEAVLNMNSEAGLLVRADEFAEAASVYRKALEYADTPQLKAEIERSIGILSEVAENLKVQKPLPPVLDLVQRLGGSMVATADGVPGSERFAEFNYNGIKYRVDLSTVFHVTSEYDKDGYDVTTIERLEERVRQDYTKSQFGDKIEADQMQDDFEDFDDDE